MKARLIKKADIGPIDAEKRASAIPVARVIRVADWVREKERRSDVAAASAREKLSQLFRQPRSANG
jgi:hypothetical protein